MSRLRGIYAITDNRLTPETTLLEQVEQALAGGVRMLQYRDKQSPAELRQQQASALARLCHDYDALLIINDDVELARSSKADGVHLGQDDEGISHAREALGHQAVIGASCYNRIEFAEHARKAGASYVAFGRFFPSQTKPNAIQAELDILEQARHLGLPVCAIGGITWQNASSIISAGADMIAVVDGIFGQPDIRKAASDLASLF
ncbi:MAG: thiamine phosphate synthase [Gammaproteobacteria bacterium]|nr:thiamine phosphate synthase [Gammaproteobacteria bacterium]